MRSLLEMVSLLRICVLLLGATPISILAVTAPLEALTASAQHSKATNTPYWTGDVERAFQAPFTEEQRKNFIVKIRSQRITSLQKGCGRLKNRLATLEDGSKVCCRFRDQNELRGDLYSYFLNSLLGLWNVPPTAMTTLDLNNVQWREVRSEALEAGWEDGTDILMVLYVEGLQKEFIPELLKPPTALLSQEKVKNLTASEQTRLLQWTDMIVFDFIIGHTDRLFNTLLNYQWNSHMMQRSVHNLEKTPSGQLILIDNESGFWVGYASAKWKQINYDFQIQFLNKICIFRRETVSSLMKLCESGKADVVLEDYMREKDLNSFKTVRKLEVNARSDFRQRVETVKEKIQQCEAAL